MEHEEATASNVAERYLLGELNATQQEAFERHYFDCAECAEDVRLTSAFIDNVKLALREPAVLPVVRRTETKQAGKPWSNWGTPAFSGIAAALVLLGVVAYQSSVVIPNLKSPKATTAIALRSLTRGPAAPVGAKRGEPILLAMDVDAPSSLQNLAVEIQNEAGGTPIHLTAPVPGPGQSLHVILSSDQVTEGAYSIIVKSSTQGSELGRYRFDLKFEP